MCTNGTAVKRNGDVVADLAKTGREIIARGGVGGLALGTSGLGSSLTIAERVRLVRPLQSN